MKIAVRGGHNFQAKGSSALIDETIENRKVYKALIKYLSIAGHNVIDVTPGDSDVNTDLYLGVQKAEDNNVELFISIHFDKAYDRYEGALGTGTWIYGAGGKAEIYAKRIVDNVSKGTGLKNRGVKTNPKLYELRKTSMPAVLVEVCFCEATEDVRIYKEKGPDIIGKLIAEAINGDVIVGGDTRPENTEGSLKEKFLKSTNAKAIVDLDPRDNPSNLYRDLGEIYKGERIRVLPEICDKKNYLPIIYWKDTPNTESQKVWVNANQNYLKIDTNATVINVVTELDARYTKSQTSSNMGYVKNGERLYIHKIENGYALGTYFASDGYKTAWFTAKYISLD
ncbi:N-acetylmuramoyl-L-alanine amidase [Clostridium perfringens]|uniref:N-acetylmuramoyl-L-alanine amidase n=1 Tax=Clostridium perfringens TaxID=1502 RepID=UPI001A26F66B|nr:N-acetylmuramoyl-L-alanine amidase [Clostridium perfringens]EGT5619071.1 N-acetylmuramoyl-L-alanine amidase [Clostridium perfringens]EHK2440763.1 N-acetylmuramoyl-L-alanine amidase [Clostridium perfringens]EJT6169739.1 N-acetylmuramoyl-L-alanine amidase [Clostridium perfringens]MBS5993979.1 N-acetylmuramoyl-L-alanine amidase [Clostridium perfringens]MDM0996578.1 N-acetylmuramoyl-L-alanine amidase [Clostridium perfringens]